MVTQATSFPYTDRTRLTIDGAGRFTIMIRVPTWATQGMSVSIDGASLPIEVTPGEYLPLNREWRSGVTVDVRIPMGLRLSRLMDQPNIASIFYGPVLLSVEEPGPLSDWRQVKINTDDIGQSLEGDPSKLRFQMGDLQLKPFFETYGRYSVYLDVSSVRAHRIR
jgi:DUF1680 family protein